MANVTTGKTHPRHFRLFLDEVNLSGFSRTVGSFGSSYAEDELTGWSSDVKWYNLGQPTHQLSGYQAVFDNTAALGSFTELKTREEYLVTLMIGVKAAPIVGSSCFCASLEQKNFIMDASGPILLNVDLIGPGQTESTLVEKVWGKVLEMGATSRTATLTGASVDNGAESTGGAEGFLHITVSDGGTWSLKIQDSTNDSDWTDLLTFAADGSAIAAERKAVAGTVDQYTRVLFSRTSGAITVACAIVRK